MKKVILALAFLVMAGCASIKTPLDSDYELGSTVGSLMNIQSRYCIETDPVKRAIMMSVIKKNFPEYPTSGACSNLLEHLELEVVEEASKELPYEEFNKQYKQALEDAEKFTKG